MNSHNGHKNWTCWNVDHWIWKNDSLKRLSLHCIKCCPNREIAAQYLLDILISEGIRETPDGAKYSKSAIRLAFRNIKEKSK